jgi:hypothetical protein
MARATAAWERRRLLTEAHELTNHGVRFVDLSVDLRVVERDDKKGTYRVPGQRGRYRVVETHRRGGVFDTLRSSYVLDLEDAGDTWTARHRGKTYTVAKSTVVWHCGPQQAPLILHTTDEPNILVYGAEGAGKTKILGMWCILQALDARHIGLRGGMTAPTGERLDEIEQAIREASSPNWYEVNEKKKIFTFATGCAVKLRTVKMYSEELGSPVQGYSWAFGGQDEIQDYAERIDADIEARLRGRGSHQRLATATAKDSSAWRNFRDAKSDSPDWCRRTLDCWSNVFELAEHWLRMERNMSPREAQRRLYAQDVKSELASYPYWNREVHLRDIEGLPLKDVSDRVLGRFDSYIRPGAEFLALVGHDPGNIFQTSGILRCYLPTKTFILAGKSRDVPHGARLERGTPIWVVEGCVQTEHHTADNHAAELVAHQQRNFGLDLEPERDDPDTGKQKTLVFCDPHGESQNKTDQGVYMAFQRKRLDIFSAAPTTNLIHIDARVEMMNRLMLSARGVVRFLVRKQDGYPVAPEVVESIEKQEKDHAGEHERVPKNRDDVTHPMVAIGYALYPLEQEKYTDFTQAAARGSAVSGLPWG